MGERNELIMLMGLPRSGKSTWAKAQGLPIVNIDAIRLALHNQRFVPDAEKFVWAMAYYMVRALFFAGHRKVILDATNVRRKNNRDHWVAPKEVWERRLVIFNTKKEVCIERAKRENDEVIIPVIERMAEQWEPPEEIECFLTIEINTKLEEDPGEWKNP